MGKPSLKDLLALAQHQDENYGVPDVPPQNNTQGMLQNLAAIAMQTGNPNTERGQAFGAAGRSYLGMINMQNKQRFFDEVRQVSSAPIDPGQKINLLMTIKAQHGTDYGLGIDDIAKQFSDLRGQEIQLRGQDISDRNNRREIASRTYLESRKGREWKPRTQQEAIDFESAKAGFKPPSQGQETTALFAGRLKQANDQFDQMAEYINTLPVVGTAMNKMAPNFMKSAEWQSYEQAQRNFLNAVLRRESGAVIAQSEFEEGRKQYFPMPGDKPAVIEQKRKNRELVTRNFIKAAGRAYEPYEQTGSGMSLTATNPTTGQKIKSLDGGQTWQPA